MSKVIESSDQVINSQNFSEGSCKNQFGCSQGKAKDNALLGNKGANPHEMTALDLPVPFGFIFTTRTCIEYNRLGEKLPDGIITQVMQVITKIEIHQGKKFGVPQNQMLVSVCSGAAVSMPGMMNTILNLGLNDKIY